MSPNAGCRQRVGWFLVSRSTAMTMLDWTVGHREPGIEVDAAQLAAASFLARYGGRPLEAYRHDLRAFFQWAADVGLAVLEATRPHIEPYRTMVEERGLAASTMDRRLSTVCGFYRFAHIAGRIAANPAQYVRRPQVHPSEARGLDRSELGVFLFTAEQYDRACGACGPALSRLGNAAKGRSCVAATTDGSIAALRIVGCDRSASARGSVRCIRRCCAHVHHDHATRGPVARCVDRCPSR